MYLYLEHLRSNCQSYVRVAELVLTVVEGKGTVYEEIIEGIAIAKGNIKAINSLIAEGTTTIRVKDLGRGKSAVGP